MSIKNYLLPIFILTCIVQIYVPASMIFEKENIIAAQHDYKFITAPLDPTDPFRGKYIALRFEQTSIEVPIDGKWIVGESIYVLIQKDRKGYAQLYYALNEPPLNNSDYLKVEIVSVNSSDGIKTIRVKLPFDRYYMEESKAYDAEVLYRETLADSTKVTYALVSIKDGKSVLKDVLIDGTSIKDLVTQ